MFWQEGSEEKVFRVPDDIVDLNFRINCRCLPLEHAHALSRALHEALPWLENEARAGIHLIHGAESGNGWIRPEDPTNEVLYVSRRTRMTLRLPKERVEAAKELTGSVLDIDGYPVGVGEPNIKLLSDSTTLFARYVIDEYDEGEEAFTQRVAREIQEMGVSLRKLMCGRIHALQTPEEALTTRSVMVADLDREDSVRLQQEGVGPGRKIGCGLFIPHKGIAAVGASKSE